MKDVDALARDALAACEAAGWMAATAESCTGGLIAGALTEIPGSSAVVDRGFVTYSNEAKVELLGVPGALIEAHGAVSAEVAEAMATGALGNSHADVAVAVTGVAGPGGSDAKPEGLVFLHAAARNGDVAAERRAFGPAGRDNVRRMTVETALTLIAALARRSQ